MNVIPYEDTSEFIWYIARGVEQQQHMGQRSSLDHAWIAAWMGLVDLYFGFSITLQRQELETVFNGDKLRHCGKAPEKLSRS